MMPPVDSQPARDLSSVAADLAMLSLQRADRLVVQIVGVSMRPLLAPGDRVLIEPLRPECRYRGQLLAVRAGAGLLVHRLLTWDEQRATLKGDACREVDPALGWPEVLGQVVAVDYWSAEDGADAARPFVPLTGRRWHAVHRLVGALSLWHARGAGPGLVRGCWRRSLRASMSGLVHCGRLGWR